MNGIPSLLLQYIATYGYVAIFVVILLQEMGVPGLPNELVLFYFGYVSRQAGLEYPVVILLVVSADIIGSFSLYFLAYHAKHWLIRIKPAWLRLPVKKIAKLRAKLGMHNGRNMFLAKLTPFVRGYLPVVAGVLGVHPFLYTRIISLSAVVWSGGWLTAGWISVGIFSGR